MTDYLAKIPELPGQVAGRVKRAKVLLEKFRPWLSRYHGGLPLGVFAAIMQAESDGKMDAPGDVQLGEAGLFQITASFPPKVGMSPESRLSPENNVFLGGLEYQIEAAKMAAQFPLIRKGSIDQWKLARLAFSIGSYGAKDLVTRALVGAPTAGPGVFDKVRAYVDAVGGVAYGSQSKEKVRYRVHFVDMIFEVGKRTGAYWSGPPQVIPAPAGVAYTFPKTYLPFTGKPGAGAAALLALAVAAVFAYARWS